MFRRQIVLAVAVLALSALPASVAAAVGVGDTPRVAFKSATDGQAVRPGRGQGQVRPGRLLGDVVRPVHGRGRAHGRVEQQVRPPRMVMVGISRDRDLNAMKAVCKEKNFNWPQMFGPATGQLAAEWGVSGIPSTFLIDPAGKVVWTGHPAGSTACWPTRSRRTRRC
jgi:hypothetical protein